MLVKLTSKNQLTLPEAVISDLEGAEYLEVTKENGRIVLTPVTSCPHNRRARQVSRVGLIRSRHCRGGSLGSPR